jgi:hypothetical protein
MLKSYVSGRNLTSKSTAESHIILISKGYNSLASSYGSSCKSKVIINFGRVSSKLGVDEADENSSWALLNFFFAAKRAKLKKPCGRTTQFFAGLHCLARKQCWTSSLRGV